MIIVQFWLARSRLTTKKPQVVTCGGLTILNSSQPQDPAAAEPKVTAIKRGRELRAV
jgi:hypothetical protein